MGMDLLSLSLSAFIGGIVALVLEHYVKKTIFSKIKILGPISCPSIQSQIDAQHYFSFNAYRLEIEVEKKLFFFGSSGKRCMCEIIFSHNPYDKFRLPWLHGNTEIDINIGSSGQVDFCAILTSDNIKNKTGDIIAPLDGSYKKYTLITSSNNQTEGKIIITSENKGMLKKSFTIIKNANNQLTISIK